MELWNNLLGGFVTAGTPINLLWAFVGCALGTAIGVLPGLGPAVTVAMLLPITGQVEPTASMIFFAGIYYGAMYGGSTTSILLNTPGETGTMVTALEGFKMAKSGQAGAALATSAIGSFVAGTIATILVTLFAPVLAEFAVKLGPPEYFCLMLLAFTTVSAVLGESTLRGLTALFIGLALGLVGMDQISGQVRYTGGVLEFMDGIEVVLVAVGLFAVSEALYNALYEGRSEASMNKLNRVHMTGAQWKRSLPAWLRGTALGFPFGCIPAGGSEIPTFLSYATERKLAAPEHQKEFGTTGAIEGVAGPEAANNSAVTATLVPLLTLGIPTSATAAVMIVAFQTYGIQPGPRLFESQGPAGLDAHRQSSHRQRDASRAQPAVGRVVGQALSHPAALSLCRASHVRLARGVCRERLTLRPVAALGPGSSRIRHAQVRTAGRAAHRGIRPDQGGACCPRSRHRGGQAALPEARGHQLQPGWAGLRW